MRPRPSPLRSSLNRRVLRPMFFASGEKLPSPVAVSSSSLPKTCTLVTGLGSQISLTLAPRPTFTRSWLGGQSRVSARLSLTVGGVVSCTVTFALHEFVLPEVSFALQVKGVIPNGKVEPDGGVQPRSWTPGQLSDTVSLKVTTAPVGPVHSATGEGHEISGFCWSTTTTFAVQVLDRPSGSVTVSVTSVVPSLYGAAGD